MSDCFNKVKEFIKESGLRISEERVKVLTDILDRKRLPDMPKAEFAAVIKKTIEEDLAQFMAKKKAADAIVLAARETAVKVVKDRRFGTDLKENMRSWLTGGALRRGDSVNLDPRSLEHTHKGRLLTIWQRSIENLEEIATSGALDKEVFIELDALQNNKPTGKTKSKEALEIAKSVNAIQNKIFDLKKAYNPYMEKADQYLIKRFHDRAKISATDKDVWVQDAMDAFGEKSFPDLSVEEKAQAFENIYDRIVDGSYGSIVDDSISDKYITINGAGGNIMKRMSRSRSLVSNSPEATFEYNAKYGHGNIDQTTRKVIASAAKDIALLEKFGPNPKGMYEGVYARVLDGIKDEAERQKFVDAKPSFDRMFNTATGLTDVPARNQAARFAQNALTAQYMAKTGSSYFRMLPDIGLSAAKITDLNGKNVFQNAHEVVTEYTKAIKNSAYRNEALADLGMFAHESVRDIMRNLGAAQDRPGALSTMAEVFGRISLQVQHVDSMRLATGLVISRQLARMADTEHVKLPKSFQDGLLRYGIRESEWNLMRRAVEDWSEFTGKESAGRVLNADSIDALPDALVENYLRKTGQLEGQATKEILDLAKYKLSGKLGVLINDHADYGSTSPNTRQKAFLTQGLSINDDWGITIRLLGQFKQALVANMDAYRRSWHSADGLKAKLSVTTQTAALTMFLWSIGEYAIQAFQGKTPQDPTDPYFIAKAVAGSGAGGIFADTLLSQADRQGIYGKKGAILANLAGPIAGAAIEGAAITAESIERMAKGKKLPKKEMASFAINQTPFQNLFYTRAAFNFYFANSLKEFLGPGYLGKLQEKAWNTPGLLEDRQRYFMFNPTESPQW